MNVRSFTVGAVEGLSGLGGSIGAVAVIVVVARIAVGEAADLQGLGRG